MLSAHIEIGELINKILNFIWSFIFVDIFNFICYVQVKTWAKLLNAFCTSGKLELELMYKVQIQCYEDAKLMKLFPEIIRSLYDQDVLAEDTILLWFRKGANPKGRYAVIIYFSPTASFFLSFFCFWCGLLK